MNYERIYNQLIERSKNRIPPEGYIEHHHIIPRCLGGSDDKANIAILTPEEHFVAHVLLVKIYPNHKKLIMGVWKMCQSSNSTKGRPTRKIYGWLRRKHSEFMKECQYGVNNSQYGKRWWCINDGFKNKRIKPNDEIPIGWKRGVVQNRPPVHNKGKIKIINGIESKFILIKDALPVGWKYCQRNHYKICKNCGKDTKFAGVLYCSDACREEGVLALLRLKASGRKYITNGIIDKRIKYNELIPEGFRPGRTNGMNTGKNGKPVGNISQ